MLRITLADDIAEALFNSLEEFLLPDLELSLDLLNLGLVVYPGVFPLFPLQVLELFLFQAHCSQHPLDFQELARLIGVHKVHFRVLGQRHLAVRIDGAHALRTHVRRPRQKRRIIGFLGLRLVRCLVFVRVRLGTSRVLTIDEMLFYSELLIESFEVKLRGFREAVKVFMRVVSRATA